MTIKIPIHSFVDLTTNSSSEVFVEATDSTVKCIEDIVNNILLSQGITDKTCGDLFDIELEELDEDSEDGSWWDENYVNREIFITSKSEDEHVTAVAKALTGFIGTFIMNSRYDG